MSRGGARSGGDEGGRLARLLDDLRGRLWLWPTVAGVLALVLAESTVRVERALADDGYWRRLAFGGDADAARAVLSTIAGAAMTVLGVTISLTLAVLALAAQGYTPRVLGRFMRDRGVQAMVASLIATFTFSLGALRLVRETEVPGVAVNIAVLLALASLGVLIGFFHHLASEIRVERVIAGAWADALTAVAALPPHASPAPRPPDGTPATLVRATQTGRLVWVDRRALAGTARDLDAVVVVPAAVGDFVSEGEVVARVIGPRAPDDGQIASMAGAMRYGTQRTHALDPAYGLRQLVDIALRALSPGVNDSTTGHEALLRAADLLRRLADRDLGPAEIDDDGVTRVLSERPPWDDLVGLVVDQAAADAEAQSDAATIVLLLRALDRVAAAVHDPERLEVLRDRARRLRDGAHRAIAEPRELERVDAAASALI